MSGACEGGFSDRTVDVSKAEAPSALDKIPEVGGANATGGAAAIAPKEEAATAGKSTKRTGFDALPPDMAGLKSGRVKAWFEDQGFGFIQQDDGSEDLFVHRRALRDGNVLEVGALVLYDTVWNEQKQKMMASKLTGASSPLSAGLQTGSSGIAAGAAAGKKTGRVKAWFEDQGFGFILQDDGGEDLFVHRRALTDGNLLIVGAPVAYEDVWNEQKQKRLASNLTGASNPMQAGIATGGNTSMLAVPAPHPSPAAGSSSSHASAASGKKTGRVKAWFEDQGFGFILQDDGGEDLFVHRRALTDGNLLLVGAPVAYDTVFNQQKQKMLAANLTGASSPIQAGIATSGAGSMMGSQSSQGGLALGMSGKKTGRVKAWFENQDFGFILQDDGGEDLFVHRRALLDGNLLIVGAPVAYDAVWNERKQKMLASNLTGASNPIQAGISSGLSAGPGRQAMIRDAGAIGSGVPGKKSGRVKAWFEDHGFGFIMQDDGGEDLFVHRRALTDGGSLVIGSTVYYELVWNEQKQKSLAAGVLGAVPQGGKGGGKGSSAVDMTAHSSPIHSGGSGFDPRVSELHGGSGGFDHRAQLHGGGGGFDPRMELHGGGGFDHRAELHGGGGGFDPRVELHGGGGFDPRVEVHGGAGGFDPRMDMGGGMGGNFRGGFDAQSNLSPQGLGAQDAGSMIAAILRMSQQRQAARAGLPQHNGHPDALQQAAQAAAAQIAAAAGGFGGRQDMHNPAAQLVALQAAAAGGMCGGYGRAPNEGVSNRFDPYGERSFANPHDRFDPHGERSFASVNDRFDPYSEQSFANTQDRYDPYGEQSFWDPNANLPIADQKLSPDLMAAALHQLSPGPAG